MLCPGSLEQLGAVTSLASSPYYGRIFQKDKPTESQAIWTSVISPLTSQVKGLIKCCEGSYQAALDLWRTFHTCPLGSWNRLKAENQNEICPPSGRPGGPLCPVCGHPQRPDLGSGAGPERCVASRMERTPPEHVRLEERSGCSLTWALMVTHHMPESTREQKVNSGAAQGLAGHFELGWDFNQPCSEELADISVAQDTRQASRRR